MLYALHAAEADVPRQAVAAPATAQQADGVIGAEPLLALWEQSVDSWAMQGHLTLHRRHIVSCMTADNERTNRDSATESHQVYVPNPLPVDDLTLPVELRPLVEGLAANAHERWALKRIREGWTFAPAGDVENKKSPWLIPYDQLPDSEKESDRVMVIGLLKDILYLGFKISKKILNQQSSSGRGSWCLRPGF